VVAENNATIVIVGTLDSKGEEVGFIRNRVIRRGCQAIVIDAGVLGLPQVEADITREEIAELGGTTLERLKQRANETSDRIKIIQVMIEGVKRAVGELVEKGELNGLISVGGSMGMAIGTSAMKMVPVGTPKLMLGTHFYPQYLGESDLTIMQSPCDIMGLNPVTELTLAQAAEAICAMASATGPIRKKRPLVGMTGLGVTTQGVMLAQRLLKGKGYDTVVFHGNSEVMDELVGSGTIDGILDFSPNELIRIFVIEETPWRMSRLDSAGDKGIPQVFVPGSLDMIVLRMAREEIPEKYRDRKIYKHGPYITGVRTTVEELKGLARVVSEKINRAKGPRAIVFPLEGFSAIDKKGSSFYDPDTDKAFLDELRANINEEVKIVEVKSHILDPEFVETVVDIYDSMNR
jgi:uncharacterized protein (UPF0261 family)